MKSLSFLVLSLVSLAMRAQSLPEKLHRLPFGSVKPAGWLEAQMRRDVAGFVGHLDSLVPDLIHDPIYGAGRLTKHSKAKDLGNSKEGDAEGDEQYKWWNSETQSNWWDGYLRNVLLLGDSAGMAKVRAYVAQVLATQDADGYLGIYAPELRYQFQSENGELWAKATLYRGLLAYYEYTQEPAVWQALVRAVDDVMRHYPVNASTPFAVGKAFSGGVAHGLTFTDVLDRMYQLTGDRRYWDYALFLYRDYSAHFSSEKDAQLPNILDDTYKLQMHGVHTYEHLRPLIVAAYADGGEQLQTALQRYLARIRTVTTVAGGPIGDEWIGGRTADATHTGYEYCSIHELMDSYTLLLQKSGDAQAAEAVERIFYNAAQGARHPEHSCIAYLKTDNSFEMLGTKNGEVEPNRRQTRYKYSPAHQDVAVCCNPNAGRISPYFVQNMWLREGENTLVAALLGPCVLQTTIGKTAVRIEEKTEYPYESNTGFIFDITLDAPTTFTLKIRKPAWATYVKATPAGREENGYVVFEVSQQHNHIQLFFGAQVQTEQDAAGKTYFTHGALVYAKPIEAAETFGRKYANGFSDRLYQPLSAARYALLPNQTPEYHSHNNRISVKLLNQTTQKPEEVELIPIGKTVLRQAGF